MAVTPWSLRGIERADAPTILALAATLDKWFNAEGLEAMARDLESHEGFVAVRGPHVAGFITWRPVGPQVADLSWMAVAESEQRAGIGRGLLGLLVSELRGRGYRRLEVSTVADSVDYEPYVATRRFYRAMGFVDGRIDPGFFGSGDDRYDRLVMVLALPG